MALLSPGRKDAALSRDAAAGTPEQRQKSGAPAPRTGSSSSVCGAPRPSQTRHRVRRRIVPRNQVYTLCDGARAAGTVPAPPTGETLMDRRSFLATAALAAACTAAPSLAQA